jgi:hypothetical protein
MLLDFFMQILDGLVVLVFTSIKILEAPAAASPTKTVRS